MSDVMCANTITEAALSIASSQVGVREDPPGSNRGTEVEMYIAAAGGKPGESWCSAFLYWCFRRASNVLVVPNPCPRTMGAQKLYYLAEPRFRRTSPTRGAIFVMDHGDGEGHVGFVDTAWPGGVISTIEGNTNREGSRNGDSVWRHGTWNPLDGKRGKLLGYIDLADAVAIPGPAAAAPVT